MLEQQLEQEHEERINFLRERHELEGKIMGLQVIMMTTMMETMMAMMMATLMATMMMMATMSMAKGKAQARRKDYGSPGDRDGDHDLDGHHIFNGDGQGRSLHVAQSDIFLVTILSEVSPAQLIKL